MKKLIAALFAAGMFAAVLGAAETQVYNANFKKDSVAWSPKKEVIKVQKNTALIVDVIGHAQSIQIGTQVPAGLEAGNYRMDCTITLSQAAKTRVYIIRNVPKWDWIAGTTVDFKAGAAAKISIPFTLKTKADYPIRVAAMELAHIPANTKVTVSSVKIFKITK
jgi:hypothetical protein